MEARKGEPRRNRRIRRDRDTGEYPTRQDASEFGWLVGWLMFGVVLALSMLATNITGVIIGAFGN